MFVERQAGFPADQVVAEFGYHHHQDARKDSLQRCLADAHTNGSLAAVFGNVLFRSSRLGISAKYGLLASLVNFKHLPAHDYF